MTRRQRYMGYFAGIVLGLGIGASCPQPSPSPTPTPMAEAVCGHLANLKCPEGLKPTCATVVQKALDTKISNLKVDCLMAARTVAAVQACGSVECKVAP